MYQWFKTGKHWLVWLEYRGKEENRTGWGCWAQSRICSSVRSERSLHKHGSNREEEKWADSKYILEVNSIGLTDFIGKGNGEDWDKDDAHVSGLSYWLVWLNNLLGQEKRIKSLLLDMCFEMPVRYPSFFTLFSVLVVLPSLLY